MCREVHRGRAARHLGVVNAVVHRREAHNHACLHVRLVEGGRVRAACSSTLHLSAHILRTLQQLLNRLLEPVAFHTDDGDAPSTTGDKHCPCYSILFINHMVPGSGSRLGRAPG